MSCSLTGSIVRLSFLLLSAISIAACDSVTDAALPLNQAPTASNVSITDDNGGAVVVGDSLSGNYIYSDDENDAEGSSTYRWLRNGATIGGATTPRYTLVALDAGQSIVFEVTPVAATGTTTGSPVSSDAIGVNSPPTASNVTITDTNGGIAQIGDSLVGSYIYADVDGDSEGSSTFRWLRDGTPIPGATSLTYTLIVADVTAASITFEVTPVAATGASIGIPVTSSGITVNNSPPIASGVSITDDNGGSAVVGDSLTGNYILTDIDGDAVTATFRWLRNDVAISGAIADTYTLVQADSGASITFEVTPVAATGTIIGNPVVSTGITVANSAPTASGVSITDDNGGSPVVGDTMTGNYTYTDIDGDSEGTSTFRWLRSRVAITGATSATYTLVALDSGSAITFEVTPVALTGTTTGTPVTSTDLIVNNSAPVASGVSITDDNGGSAIVGDSLTGNYTYADIDGDAEGLTTFRWLRNNTITVGTAATYTLVAADSGASITFEVTPVAATGTLTGSAVSSSGITVVNSAPVADAGPDQTTPLVGETVTLDGSGSSDVDGDSLTYSWSFTSVPKFSKAKLDLTDPLRPTFVADLSGTYTVQLIVNDTLLDSAPDTVSIITAN